MFYSVFQVTQKHIFLDFFFCLFVSTQTSAQYLQYERKSVKGIARWDSAEFIVGVKCSSRAAEMEVCCCGLWNSSPRKHSPRSAVRLVFLRSLLASVHPEWKLITAFLLRRVFSSPWRKRRESSPLYKTMEIIQSDFVIWTYRFGAVCVIHHPPTPPASFINDSDNLRGQEGSTFHLWSKRKFALIQQLDDVNNKHDLMRMSGK